MFEMLRLRWREDGGFAEVLKLSIPLVLSSASATLMQFVDRMFLTWDSPSALAAAFPAGVLNFTIISIFLFTASYLNTFVSQFSGAKRPLEIGSALWQAIYFSILSGAVLLIEIPFATTIFNHIGHEASVRKDEISYFSILALGNGAVVLNGAFSGFLSGLGKTMHIMWVNVVINIIHVVLDYVLIFGNFGCPAMGISGAAWSSVICTVIGSFVFAFIIFTKSNERMYKVRSFYKFNFSFLKRLLYFGFPSGLQVFIDVAAFSIFLFLLGRLGQTELAASNLAFSINSLAFQPMFGVGAAISVLVGRYQGAKKPELATRSVYSGFFLAFTFMTTISILYFFTPNIFIAPFAAKVKSADFTKVVEMAVVLLKFVAFFSLFDAVSVIFSAALRGAGDTRFVMVMVLCSALFGLIVPAYIVLVVFKHGAFGAWLVLTAYIFLLALAFFTRFLSGRWKTMRVIEDHPTPQFTQPVVESPLE
ncbi:MAG: MATE family efflux transporter [Fibrobacteres bacterium]|nr:MATE family efflux transporter [Fibrobacterota bacterium]